MDGGPSPTRARLAFAVLLALAAVAGTFRVHNLDLGLHARTGEWILEHGEVPTTNVLSPIHGDHPSVHDKWGFQVLAHLVWDGAGADAVVALRVLWILALFAVLWATARGLGASPGMTLLVLTLALVAMRSRFLFRPGLLSLLLLAVVVHVVLVARADGRRAARRLLPLQVLWVNVHGYFLLGYLTVGAVAAGHLLRGRAGRATGLRFAGLALAMVLACFLNPSGVAGFLHPFAILEDLSEHRDFYTSTIEEFRPTFAPDPRGSYDRAAFFVLLGAAAVVLAWSALAGRRRGGAASSGDADPTTAASAAPATSGDAWKRLGWPLVLLVVQFAVMSRSLHRSIALFAVAAGPVVAGLASARLGPRVPGLVLPVAFAVVVALGEVTDATSVHDGLEREWGTGVSTVAYPDRGIDFFAEELPTVGVFTAFRYGSTFTGRRWPEQAASTNGNTHGYPTAWFQDVMSAVSMEDPLAFDRLCDRHGLDAALVPMACPLSVRLLRRDDWRLVRLGTSEAVYVRAAAVDDAFLARHDLEARLRAGALPGADDLPVTPPCGTVLGLPRACRPLTEIAAAVLFRGAGLGGAARALAARAAEHPSRDVEALTLDALLDLADGAPDAAERLREQLARGGVNRFADEARAALGEG